ncbi:MAG: sigma-70 family RNA polymerase sigma factor [Thermosynechococcaceae cyanobacterium]
MKLPEFSEANHPLVRDCLEQSDRNLVQGFQDHPDQGRYFVAIFCRYAMLTYALLRNKARIALQVDYLFAQMWRNIFFEIRHLQIDADEADDFSLQTWIISKSALCINQDELPAIETIQYALAAASPPFWCYLHLALDELPPLSRLLLVLSQLFRWPESRIAAMLQAEGEDLEIEQIQPKLRYAYRHLQDALPEDIRAIYLPELSEQASLPMAEQLTLGQVLETHS